MRRIAAAPSCSSSSPTNTCSGVFSRARRPTTASRWKGAQQDVLVCITGHIGQGYLESGVAQMMFTRDHGKDIGLSLDFLLTATDSTGAHGANTVTCKESSKYFGVSKMAAGPRPMTVTVKVEYADAATIRAACGKGFPKPKETFGSLPKGEPYVPTGYVKKGKFVIDLASRAVTPPN